MLVTLARWIWQTVLHPHVWARPRFDLLFPAWFEQEWVCRCGKRIVRKKWDPPVSFIEPAENPLRR